MKNKKATTQISTIHPGAGLGTCRQSCFAGYPAGRSESHPPADPYRGRGAGEGWDDGIRPLIDIDKPKTTIGLV